MKQRDKERTTARVIKRKKKRLTTQKEENEKRN